MIELLYQSILIIFVYANIWFLISIIIKRNDYADVAWGLGYLILSSYYIISIEASFRSIILFVLISLWGLRLTISIYIKNSKKTEDSRYLKWRQEWGKFFYIRSYLQIYLLQGLFVLIIISPLIIVNSYPQSSLNILDLIGIIIWIIGFYFETVSDYQLAIFKSKPSNKNKILQTGLWKYSRHPNYFGEVTMWWGIFIICISSINGIYGIISPITITVLILYVSGIPMLENKYKNNPEYKIYKQKTSIFIPMKPKIKN